MAARISGPTQGVYQCHIRQMIVRKPMNINDEDLVDGITCIAEPLSHPTTMSYCLQRIRLAEISRNIVDRSPLMMAHTGPPSHDVVVDIETEIQMLLNETPPFFSMSIPALIETYQLSPSRAADIYHQGYMFYSLLYAQRCKLHLPSFSNGFVDPTYAASRQACFQSARLIIQLEVKLDESGVSAAERYKFLPLFLAVFMATAVLSVDLCHKKSSTQRGKSHRELDDTFRKLELARSESETAARAMDFLLEMMRKHKVSPPESNRNTQMRQSIPSGAIDHNATTPTYTDSTAISTSVFSTNVQEHTDPSVADTAGDGLTNGEDMTSYFNEFSQSFEQGFDIGSFDWDSYFSRPRPSTHVRRTWS
jgi:hypothetical protein